MSRNTITFLKEAGWWTFFFVCAFYAFYAFYMAAVEIFFELGFVTDAPPRAVPFIFIIHALAGGIVLISGPLQFNRRLRSRNIKLHRALGRTYVTAIWVSSIAGLWSALFFEVNIAAKIVFAVLSGLWFGTTIMAFLSILESNIAAHREWMIRSFALSFFFVSFSFWVPGLTGTSLPEAISYPLAVFLSWSLNLLAAELWIRRTRLKTRPLPAGKKHQFIQQKPVQVPFSLADN